jgi:hypothetical protein
MTGALICDRLDGVLDLPNDMSNLSSSPRDLRRGSAATGLLGLRVRILPAHGHLCLVSFIFCQVEVSAT